MKKSILMIVSILLITYIVICGLLYLIQEKLIFFPEKLDKKYQFGFNQTFEELNIRTEDNVFLNAILFRADASKGLIFYLHGNAGSLRSWGEIAKTYTDLNYDLFMMDYRGYGKSEGVITSQKQLYNDLQTVYDNVKTRYAENKIIILGYSVGTGFATKLASSNHPRLLILQAPFFSLTDMMKHYFPIIPSFILKYKFETNKYIKDCDMPIIIFHGDKDEVIYYKSSLKLQPLIKETDTLITLIGQRHNGMSSNVKYLEELEKILMY
jgi:alpha-beta hydrolase superfamily lysophospholipase